MRTAIYMTGLLISGKADSKVDGDLAYVLFGVLFFIMDVIELVI